MSKLRKFLLIALTVCATVCLSTVIAACSNKKASPDYRNPSGLDMGNSVKYTVSVMSKGGLPLDGVRISATKNNETVMSGYTANGSVKLALEPDVYEIVIDESSLPEGYAVEEGEKFFTSADTREVKVTIPSKVKNTTAPSSYRYAEGDVMYNFSFISTEGETVQLSELLEEYSAVMLNFWYINCHYCELEFPSLQSAYASYANKIAIIALSAQDSNTAIKDYKEQNGLTFYMAHDAAGVSTLFNITAAPTSVMIDRYGVFAYRHDGYIPSETTWKSLFEQYTSDSYVQSSTQTEKPVVTEREKPDPSIAFPSSDEISSAINGRGTEGKVSYGFETNEEDAEYNWPWIIKQDNGGASYLTASNSGHGLSYAIMYINVSLESGDVFSYEYNVDVETGYDFLYVIINGGYISHTGNSEGWKKQYAAYVADRDVNLSVGICFIKDEADDPNIKTSDTASIRNITVTKVSDETEFAVDQRIAIAGNVPFENGKYDITAELGDNGYYYVSYDDGNGGTRKALLLANISEVAPWAEMHIGSDRFTSAENTQEKTSLYMYSFWNMSNYQNESETVPLQFNYGHTDTIVNAFNIQGFSENELMPVTAELKDAINAFIDEYYKTYDKAASDPRYDDQWLEFCYYYKHYGESDNHASGFCSEKDDPIKGLIWETCLKANIGKNDVNITKIYKENGGGIWYSFTPEYDGVFRFFSTAKDVNTDPAVTVYDENGIMIMNAEDDVSPNHFKNKYRFNYDSYVTLQGGKTYRVQARMNTAGGVGAYSMNIEYAGTSINHLRVCTTEDGIWTYAVDDKGNMLYEYYVAIPVARKEGIYYAVTNDNNYGSKVYVDFIHPNYFDENDNSLYSMIKAGVFDFSKAGGDNYTAEMTAYYQQSVQGKSFTDETYGMLEANENLVSILNTLIMSYLGNGPEANAWLMFANYYEYYSL